MYNHSFALSFEIPSSADEWNLYRKHIDSPRAAAEITEALKKAFDYVVSAPDATPAKAMSQFMLPVMNKHVKTGAVDTVPVDIAMMFLRKAQKLREWCREPV